MGKLAGPGEHLSSDASGILDRVQFGNQKLADSVVALDKAAADAVAQAGTVKEAASATVLIAQSVANLFNSASAILPVLGRQVSAAAGLSAAQEAAASDCWLKNLLAGKPLFGGLDPTIATAASRVLPPELSRVLTGV